MTGSGSKAQTRAPTTGMRGGLGRTLLTAFLALAIAPLFGFSWYVGRLYQNDTLRMVNASLSSTADATAREMRQIMSEYSTDLKLLATLSSTSMSAEFSTSVADGRAAAVAVEADLDALRTHMPALEAIALFDADGSLLATSSVESADLQNAISQYRPRAMPLKR